MVLRHIVLRHMVLRHIVLRHMVLRHVVLCHIVLRDSPISHYTYCTVAMHFIRNAGNIYDFVRKLLIIKAPFCKFTIM